MSPQLIVFFLSMLPVIELRGAIPLGIFLGLSPVVSFVWAEIGNIIPVLFLVKFLGPISDWLSKHFKFFKRLIEKIFSATREKHGKKVERWGEAFIVILTSIPLPGTGAWTGALIAFLFDVPYWRAILLILAGNFIAGIVIWFGIDGATELTKLFH